MTERLDKGLLAFDILIQPADLSKYDYVNLPDKDMWGVVTRKDSPLAAKRVITRQDWQAIRRTATKNEFAEWFKNIRVGNYIFTLSKNVTRQSVAFKNRYGIMLVADLYMPKTLTPRASIRLSSSVRRMAA